MLNRCDPRVALLTAKDEVPGVSSATLPQHFAALCTWLDTDVIAYG